MAEELEELCGNISLTEGEQYGIKISEGEIALAREKGTRCLVGKIWTGKRTNQEAFKQVLSKIWRTRRGVIFKEVQDNLWIFEFEEDGDKRRVLEGRPWSFDRQILVINELEGNTPPSQMKFSMSPFWVQVHDMPLVCMTKGVGVKIGESLGNLEEVDVAGDGAGWGRCLRIRVSIDITKPLDRGRALELGGKSTWVPFKYEKLPLFCFSCGRIVHGDQGCPVRRPTRLSTVEETKKWGVCLRADDPRRRWNGGSKDYYSATDHSGEGMRDRAAASGGPVGNEYDRESSESPGISHRGMQLQRAVGDDYGSNVIGSADTAKGGEQVSPTFVCGDVDKEANTGHQEDVVGLVLAGQDGLFSKKAQIDHQALLNEEIKVAQMECEGSPTSAMQGFLNFNVENAEGNVNSTKGDNVQTIGVSAHGTNIRKWKRSARGSSGTRAELEDGVLTGNKRKMSIDGKNQVETRGGRKGKILRQAQEHSGIVMAETVKQSRQIQ
ncbi:uncharacterized protein LOC132178037 [Corylus avellana]|uniref:uncharacterized protein LOC132178037 n=1 Tax=Corylus avellana TaxID=13451 RepID=UPI00286CB87A|nr:uncharacterized protein LOC132178037 [Corylus avellana]